LGRTARDAPAILAGALLCRLRAKRLGQQASFWFGPSSGVPPPRIALGRRQRLPSGPRPGDRPASRL